MNLTTVLFTKHSDEGRRLQLSDSQNLFTGSVTKQKHSKQQIRLIHSEFFLQQRQCKEYLSKQLFYGLASYLVTQAGR